MATYAVQFITKDGAFCGSQRILNRAKAMQHVQDGDWPNIRPGQKGSMGCVVITVSANSAMERTKLRNLAVSQVFHERVRAIDWLKQLLTDEEQT